MPKKNEIPLKEKYRLWWEYLNRSSLFEEFSSFFRNKTINQETHFLLFDFPERFFIKHKVSIDRESKDLFFPQYFLPLVKKIETYSFEEWWTDEGLERLDASTIPDKYIVDEYINWVDHDFEECQNYADNVLKKKNGFLSLDDFLNQGMSDHVLIREIDKFNAVDPFEDTLDFDQPGGFVFWKVDLGDVPSNDSLGAEAQSR